jgi:hypothetical protein
MAMPQPSSGILWLVLGLVSGVASLGCCGIGGFSVWHTHGNVQMAQAGVNRHMREMEQLAPLAKLPQNQRRFQELGAEKGSGVDYYDFNIRMIRLPTSFLP